MLSCGWVAVVLTALPCCVSWQNYEPAAKHLGFLIAAHLNHGLRGSDLTEISSSLKR